MIWIVLALIGAAGTILTTWLLANVFVSPEQLEAAATPPDPTVVTAQVSKGDLIERRTVAGEIVPSSDFEVLVTPPTDATRSVVTSVAVQVGVEVTVGSEILRINDAPSFLIRSPFAFYRDLGPGDTGADVLALQQSLAELGLVDQVDGVYGGATDAAVRALFKRVGAEAPRRQLQETEVESTDSSTSPSAGASPTPAARQVAISQAYLPVSSTLTISESPVVFTQVPQVGDLVSTDTVARARDQSAVVDASLFGGLSAVDLIGQTINITLNDGTETSGVAEAPPAPAESDAESAQSNSPSDSGQSIRVRPASANELSGRLGEAATLAVDVRVIAEDALLLPRAAVAEGESPGAGSVLVRDGDVFRQVKVAVLGATGGEVAIESDDGALVEGAEVLIE